MIIIQPEKLIIGILLVYLLKLKVALETNLLSLAMIFHKQFLSG